MANADQYDRFTIPAGGAFVGDYMEVLDNDHLIVELHQLMNSIRFTYADGGEAAYETTEMVNIYRESIYDDETIITGEDDDLYGGVDADDDFPALTDEEMAEINLRKEAIEYLSMIAGKDLASMMRFINTYNSATEQAWGVLKEDALQLATFVKGVNEINGGKKLVVNARYHYYFDNTAIRSVDVDTVYRRGETPVHHEVVFTNPLETLEAFELLFNLLGMPVLTVAPRADAGGTYTRKVAVTTLAENRRQAATKEAIRVHNFRAYIAEHPELVD